MTELEPVRAYLKRWANLQDAAHGGALTRALSRAQEEHTSREQAALALSEAKDTLPVSPVLEQNRALLELILGSTPDLICRECELGMTRRPAMLLFLDTVVKKDFIMTVLTNLVVRLRDEEFPAEPAALQRYLALRGVTSTEVSRVTTAGGIIRAILSGDTVLLADKLPEGIRLSSRGWDHRQPEEPIGEPVVRGPKEGFTETLAANMALVRRRLMDERLRVETLTVEERSGTTVAIIYMAGLTLPELVAGAR